MRAFHPVALSTVEVCFVQSFREDSRESLIYKLYRRSGFLATIPVIVRNNGHRKEGIKVCLDICVSVSV